MSNSKLLEIQDLYDSDDLAESISNKYASWKSARSEWEKRKEELFNYITATDTSTLSNASNGWKNSTHLPKICQIRDNLHAHYYSALFSSANFMKFDQYTGEEADRGKAKAIEAYMENKLRESEFRKEISKCIYDYIDWGTPIADVEYVTTVIELENGEKVQGYVGPKAVRICPNDIVFDPLSASFADSPKITRVLRTVGELKNEASTRPELQYNLEAIASMEKLREELLAFSTDDIYQATRLRVDGFGDLTEYLQSPMVELLIFEGDIHDTNGVLLQNQKIVVMDRTKVIYQSTLPSWYGKSLKCFTSWRKTPDNLYGMGPLDNLVGLQYRIDHIENLKADLFDLTAFPPIVVRGGVREFLWQPGEIIHVEEDGSVDLLKVDTGVLQYNFEINQLMNQMEDMAGSPKQSMGIRTPGEKTAYEVQALENAAGRLFQDKVTQFEMEFLEPLLNNMVEIARRNLNQVDVVKVMDADLGVEDFIEVTKEDLTTKGKIRAVGARHFIERAQTVQNLTNFFNSALGQDPLIKSHFSALGLAKMAEDLFDLSRYGLVVPNIRLEEEADAQRIMNQMQEDTMIEQTVDVEDENI